MLILIWILRNKIFNYFIAVMVMILFEYRISHVSLKVCKVVLILLQNAFIYRKILRIRKRICLKIHFGIFYFFPFLIYDASGFFFSEWNRKLFSFWKHIFIFVSRQDEVFRILVTKVKVLMIHFIINVIINYIFL